MQTIKIEVYLIVHFKCHQLIKLIGRLALLINCLGKFMITKHK